MKLASLFDGISGFPRAGSMLGIEPIWASEIEKFPIAVGKHHFPNMKHYGSVCDINGTEVEPVDIITFGSPCQDLSVAGKRAGMGEGTRSGLFSEAVRIIKEMRDATNGTFPRYAVWENVPGAFSSNKGEDFRAVIESLAKIAEETVSIPLPKDGRWEPAGLVEGDGWSIAWRTLDAQFWGVPQRRKRIFLVADFGGQCASEIFFEREGVSGDIAASGNEREETTGGVERGVRTAGCFKWGQGSGSHGIGHAVEQSPTLPSNAGGNTAPAVYPINGMVIGKELKGDDRQTTGIGEDGEPSPTIRAQGHQHSVCCVHATQDPITAENRSHALGANSSQAICFEPRSQDGVPRIHESGICPTLNTAEGGQRQPYSTVRRLTPLECERLQGFQDYWTDIGLSDSARYKALGNSVAIPCVKFILGCIVRTTLTDCGDFYAKMD